LRQASGDSVFVGMMNAMLAMARMVETPPSENTVIGVVASNARLNKEQTNKVAQMAHDGLARAIRPAHTMFDGDTIFALSTGQIPANVNVIGAYAAEVVEQAIRNAVRAATSLDNVRSWQD
jgi:L-aminopeptidase/D-esterase-like protein